MGKYTKIKKNIRIRSERAKLRVKNEKTKFLPKGLNITKTDFKVKAIVINEQLKGHKTGELLSKRKLNIKDILTRLRHHNKNVKYNCCEELEQLLHAHGKEIIELHLAAVLQGLAQLLLDADRKTRRISVKLLEMIIANVDEYKIASFFPILSSHLRCAMTNINDTIQEDSLLFLDVLLKYTPQCAANDRNKILLNLFLLISKLKSNSEINRTLTVNLEGKLTSVKWRIQVLTRLHAFLRATFNMLQKSNESSNDVSLIQVNAKPITIYCNPYKLDSHPMIGEVADRKTDIIYDNIEVLMPLLLEIWMEVAPPKTTRKDFGFTNIDEDALWILGCVLNIIEFLHEYVLQTKNQPLDTKVYANILQNIKVSFPYTLKIEDSDGLADDASDITEIGRAKAAKENLLFCYLYVQCHSDKIAKETSTKFKKILKFTNSTMLRMTQNNVKYFLKFARIVLVKDTLKDIGVDYKVILKKFTIFFKKCPDSPAKYDFYDLLYEMTHLEHIKNKRFLYKKIARLPQLLCQPTISARFINIFSVFAKEQNLAFLNELQQRLDDILDNLDKIEITDCENQTIAKRNIIQLFYYIQTIESGEEREKFRDYLTNCDDSFKPLIKTIITRE